MEKVLTTIEQLRQADEATRQRALVLTVAAAVLLLGALWVFSFRTQLASAESAGAAATAAETSSLPSVGELFKKSGSSLISGTKSGLKGFILGEESDNAVDSSTTTKKEAASDEKPKYHRLPKSE